MDFPIHFLLFVILMISVRSCYSSSFYVGRQAAGSIGSPQIVQGCEDFNARKCQKIISWHGRHVCNAETSAARSLTRICPNSCGLCDCKDALGEVCKHFTQYCNIDDETGVFLKHNCAKTCNTCHLSGGESEYKMVALT